MCFVFWQKSKLSWIEWLYARKPVWLGRKKFPSRLGVNVCAYTNECILLLKGGCLPEPVKKWKGEEWHKFFAPQRTTWLQTFQSSFSVFDIYIWRRFPPLTMEYFTILGILYHILYISGCPIPPPQPNLWTSQELSNEIWRSNITWTAPKK